MKQRWTLQMAEQHLKAHAASGLTKKDYFRSQGIKAATFYYWQQQLQESKSASIGFTEVKVAVNKEVEVQLASGRWLAVRSADTETLAEVLVKIGAADA